MDLMGLGAENAFHCPSCLMFSHHVFFVTSSCGSQCPLPSTGQFELGEAQLSGWLQAYSRSETFKHQDRASYPSIVRHTVRAIAVDQSYIVRLGLVRVTLVRTNGVVVEFRRASFLIIEVSLGVPTR